MAEDIVMLSNYFDKVPEKDLVFPMHMTEKLDGIMADFYKKDGVCHIRTRQNKPIPSMQWFVDVHSKYLSEGEHLIGELYHDYKLPRVKNFEKLSGRIRQQSEQATEVGFYMFDRYEEGKENISYAKRDKPWLSLFFDSVPDVGYASDANDALLTYNKFMKNRPNAEGVVLRPLYGPTSYYKRGRSKGFLKIVPKPTVDLPILDIIEADKTQAGQAGKVICEYNGKKISVGMGSIVHSVRKDMWENKDKYLNKIVEIKYKDVTDAGVLRMPVILRFREDKDGRNN